MLCDVLGGMQYCQCHCVPATSVVALSIDNIEFHVSMRSTVDLSAMTALCPRFQFANPRHLVDGKPFRPRHPVTPLSRPSSCSKRPSQDQSCPAQVCVAQQGVGLSKYVSHQGLLSRRHATRVCCVLQWTVRCTLRPVRAHARVATQQAEPRAHRKPC